MIQLDNLRDLLEPFLELLDLLEMITKFDDGSRSEHPVWADDELAMLERVYVALDEQKVGAALHRQEARTRNVDPMCILEMLDRGACSSFEL